MREQRKEEVRMFIGTVLADLVRRGREQMQADPSHHVDISDMPSQNEIDAVLREGVLLGAPATAELIDEYARLADR